ncbi:hypothetical protein OBV_p-00310 (plasmid) [Oscillibacter valericigenes Sjm18-20]|nr:hypothetical protein OBV_p-00310 [Oscillibacter valericigenes Sjm18-20]
MKRNFKKSDGRKKIVMQGKGREYSDVSKEIEKIFFQWLQWAGVSPLDFYTSLKKEPYNIAEQTLDNGDVSVVINAGFLPAGAPLIWEKNGCVGIDDFHANVLLLLLYIAAHCENRAFKKEVSRFCDRLIA